RHHHDGRDVHDPEDARRDPQLQGSGLVREPARHDGRRRGGGRHAARRDRRRAAARPGGRVCVMTAPLQPGRPSVLVVDDDETFRATLARSLVAHGYDVWPAGSYVEAVGRVLAEPPAFTIVDLRMPGRSGFELID